MARRLVYCKVVLATSMVWFLLDVMLIMYYSECTNEARCSNQALDHGVPREDGGHEHAPPKQAPPKVRHDPNGPGEMGKAVIIPQDKESLKNEMFRINQFNLLASDMISVNRSLPDVRMDGFGPHKPVMERSGFQPVCVLFTGSGSCQLVCKHQIQEDAFGQGDLVQVADVAKSDGKWKEESELRQAIVMGDDMRSTLLENLFQSKEAKGNRDTDESRKRKRPTELNLSETDKESAETGLLQEVLSTVRQLKSRVDQLGVTLKDITHQQGSTNRRLAQLQDTLQGNGERRISMAPIKKVQRPAQASMPTPIITSVVSGSNEGRILDAQFDHVVLAVNEEDNAVPEVRKEEGNQQGPAECTPPPKRRRGRVFQSPTYFMESNEDYMAYIIACCDETDTVHLGSSSYKVFIPLTELQNIIYKSNNVSSFAYRMAGLCFSHEEMIAGNTRGGQNFHQLNPRAVHMIVGEVKRRFPHCASDKMLLRSVRNAINERARNERKRMTKSKKEPTACD